MTARAARAAVTDLCVAAGRRWTCEYPPVVSDNARHSATGHVASRCFCDGSLGCVPIGGDDHDGSVCSMGDLVGDATEQPVLEVAATVCAEHDQLHGPLGGKS